MVCLVVFLGVSGGGIIGFEIFVFILRNEIFLVVILYSYKIKKNGTKNEKRWCRNRWPNRWQAIAGGVFNLFFFYFF